jgi:molybdate transport system ATP-binding protein
MIGIGISCRRGGFALAADLELPDGITGIVGPSGAGKSTLLLAIAGLVRCERDHVAIAGRSLAGLPPHRRRIGTVFQAGLLFPHLSVEANLRYGMGGQPPIPFARIAGLLRLDGLLARRPATLSGGEQQRVALGRALLSAPRLLLCDEPLSSLDRAHRQEILPFLAGVWGEFAIPMLYVSHDLGEVLALTDRLVVLDQGRVAGHGTFDALRADAAVRPLLYDETLARRLAAP